MDPSTIDGVIGSLAQLGPAGVIAGGWIFSLLRRLTIATERNKELEDREYEQLKEQTAVLHKFAGLLEQEHEHHRG